MQEDKLSEDGDSGDVADPLVLMTPSSLISPTKKAPASCSPMGPVYLRLAPQRKNVQKTLYESNRKRRIDEATRKSFL